MAFTKVFRVLVFGFFVVRFLVFILWFIGFRVSVILGFIVS